MRVAHAITSRGVDTRDAVEARVRRCDGAARAWTSEGSPRAPVHGDTSGAQALIRTTASGQAGIGNDGGHIAGSAPAERGEYESGLRRRPRHHSCRFHGRSLHTHSPNRPRDDPGRRYDAAATAPSPDLEKSLVPRTKHRYLPHIRRGIIAGQGAPDPGMRAPATFRWRRGCRRRRRRRPALPRPSHHRSPSTSNP
jgi:hypothetical protein